MTAYPSPYDVLKRWPRAAVALSSLMLAGDMKHSDDGRQPGRGVPIDQERYNLEYCWDKMLRHLVRTFDPDYDPADPSTENGVPEEIAVLFYAFQAAEVVLTEASCSVEDIIQDHVAVSERPVIAIGGYVYGEGWHTKEWYGGTLLGYVKNKAVIKPDWCASKLKTLTLPDQTISVYKDSLTTERPK